MDIFIKSFNRVYYLDRCLVSINTYLDKYNKIYILDDGTPQTYLDAIKTKYPKVTILKSDDYDLKSKLLNDRDFDNLPNRIPSKFWYESTKNSTEYVMVLEDDMWFTKKVDINCTIEECVQEEVAMMKLFWLGNKKLIRASHEKHYKNTSIYKPKLKFNHPIIYNLVYNKYHKLWRQSLSFFGIYSLESELNYYTIYSVAGAIYRKDYYLSIWKGAGKEVYEKQQLFNALNFYKKNKVRFGRMNTEVLKTGFVSSAFTKKNSSEFSIHDFNSVLNTHWLKHNEFYIKDLSVDLKIEDIKNLLLKLQKSSSYIEEWEDWVNRFKQSYINIGCHI